MVMLSLSDIIKTAKALNREDATPEHESIQGRFRVKIPKLHGRPVTKSGAHVLSDPQDRMHEKGHV